MTRAEVVEALNSIDISVDVDDDASEVDIDHTVDYLGVKWTSFNIAFNKQGLVDKVSFYFSGDGYINKYALVDELSKKLGESQGGLSMTTWSAGDKWLVTFADNKSPFPKCLTYWYKEYFDQDSSDDSDDSE